MKKVSTYLCIVVAIALNSFTSYAQTCQLLGTVSGPEDVPVEYVTIEIYEDSSFLWGTISKEDGGFSIEDLQCGSTYHLKARYFGYQTVEQEFTAQTNASPLALRLQVDSKELDEIVVSEKRPTIERKADRLIYFVNQSFVAGKNSAFDVLKTTPSVWIDNNGLIRINGKAGTRVMINGKMLKVSGMELQNYLNGIEGKDIIKIEVIAMPGSEFDAESKGGVINIELRKRFLDGYNARLFAGGEQGRYPEYSTGIFSNYKKGKLTTTANFYIFQRNNFADNQEDRSNQQEDFLLESSFFSRRKINNHQVRLGADYDFNAKHTLNFEYVRTYNRNNTDIDALSLLNDGGNRSNVNGIYDTQNTNKYNGSSLNYRWKTDTLGSNIKVVADYVYNDNLGEGLFSSDYMDHADVLIFNNTTSNRLKQISNIFSGKIDYQHVIQDIGSIQLGAKYGYSDIDNQAVERTKTKNGFVINPDRTNDFTYGEAIYAAYANFSGKWKKLQYKFGARFEDSFIDGISDDRLTSFDVRYTNVFPSAFLAMEFGKKNNSSVSLAANRKINRPNFESLNPFEYVLNEFSISRGNPSLRPEYATNVELNYSYQNNYNLGLVYQKTEDIINQLLIANEEVAVYEMQNISQQETRGLTLGFSLNSFKGKLQSYFYTALANNHFQSDVVDESLTTLYARINNSFPLFKGINANVSFNFTSRELLGNRIYDPYGQVDLNLSKSLLNNKLRISVGATDIFNFQNNNSVLVDADETIEVVESFQSRKVQLYIFYNFSTGKSFSKKRIESASDSEKSRLKG